MTKNIGTAAYMAPELTSLKDFLTIPKHTGVSASSNDLSPEQQAQELACQHPMPMEESDLSSTSLNLNPVRNKPASRLQTMRDRAAKVRIFVYFSGRDTAHDKSLCASVPGIFFSAIILLRCCH